MDSKSTIISKLVVDEWRHCLICMVMLFSCQMGGMAQSKSTQTLNAKEVGSKYLALGFGLNRSYFRDFATSPLIYSGYPLHISLSYIELDKQRESAVSLSYSFGQYKTDFNNHASESMVNTVSFNYLELFQLENLSTAKFNLKVGGQFNATANHRENAALFNNDEGVDLISTLFASAKGTLDLSREEEKSKKFLFINYTLKKRVRRLSYNLNVGVVNSSYRNGFAYLSPSAPLNEDDFFADYELHIFKGFRLNSTLDYTIYLQNKNAVQFSYVWDAYRTGGHHDNFEMAAHILKVSLLFGLK